MEALLEHAFTQGLECLLNLVTAARTHLEEEQLLVLSLNALRRLAAVLRPLRTHILLVGEEHDRGVSRVRQPVDLRHPVRHRLEGLLATHVAHDHEALRTPPLKSTC